ncbi:diguanylate cyclase response regulator [candidate division LCP-89 bacterium B3_LCP]|uniref:diguanylate cyclase n=1 Tax=candidate division LCP-89 bacterium B3_LCP TaxID=2012998 RepID=A0A532UTZ3_UNCL8|nr:MAG: diguanylate cyclase response regulator [candidate division LCP-89 bacterium B3_LCP]
MSYSILVVDDSWESREVITSILSINEDYSLAMAENGEEAMGKLQTNNFDLVVTDISMPVMDGLELLDHLVKNKPSLPVITFTGFGDIFGVKALERGAEDCIFKPFDARDFKLRIAKALKYSRLKKYQDLLEQKNKELRQISTMDQLTQLYNRHYMQDVLQREFTRAKRYRNKLSCVMIDIDHFKKINDEYGHMQGDSVLREFAGLLKNTCREVDVPCRFGGEEFLIILPETDRRGAECMADRLRRATETMPIFRVESAELLTELKISVSVGLSAYPDPRIRSEMDMITLADEALYLAKNQGRNCVMVA